MRFNAIDNSFQFENVIIFDWNGCRQKLTKGGSKCQRLVN